MFRTWLSSFWRKYKDKITDALKKVVMVILISYCTAFIFSNINMNKDENSTSNITSTVYKPTETIISGDNISEKQYEEDKNIINIFIDYCNKGDTDNAYQLLTDDCKENMYPTKESFIRKYYNIIFDKNKSYSLQSWVKNNEYNTYKVRMIDDILATGDYDSSKQYEDYITIVTMDDEDKISIGGFICTQKINQKTETKEFVVTAIEKNVYMDYETYTLEITNNTKNTIILSELENAGDNITLTDDRGVEYKVDEKSVNEVKLKVLAGQTKKLEITFDKSYDSETRGEKINFSKIIMNYDLYKEEQYDADKSLSVLL